MRKTAAKPAPGQVALRLLATSDVHACLLGWNYLADCPSPSGGLARIATLAARLRQDADLTLLVDNGDFLNGSPLGDTAANGLAPGAPNPVIAAMNAMGYDAASLGNHEFSQGMPALTAALAASDFPLLSANILREAGPHPAQDDTLLPPSLLLRRQPEGHPPITIGLIGLTPPRTLQWEAGTIGCPLAARDMAEAAAHHAADLRARGADLVIALCHSGFGADTGHSAAKNDAECDADRVARLPGIDAVVAGHTHQLFPDPDRTPKPDFDPITGKVHGKPSVMPGFGASHLGVIDFTLEHNDDAWRITESTVRLEPAACRDSTSQHRHCIPEDPAILRLAQPAQRGTRARLNQLVGRNARPMTTHFALVRPNALIGLIAEAKIAAVRAALAGTEHAGLTVLASAAPYRAGGFGGPGNYSILPEGDIALRHLADLYPHPNQLIALRLTGAELARWIEASSRVFRQIAPDSRDTELIDERIPSSAFDMVQGLGYTIDLSAPATPEAKAPTRIRDLTLDGAPLAPDRPVILATNDFRLTGARAEGLADRVVLSGIGTSQDALHRHIEASAALDTPGSPQWRFAPMPGTTVLFDSAPDAVPCLPDIEPLALGPGGFRRFRLHL